VKAPALVLGFPATKTEPVISGYRADGSPIYTGRVMVVEEKKSPLPPPPPVVTSLPQPGAVAKTVALWDEGKLVEVTVPAAPVEPERDWQADVAAITPKQKPVIVSDAVKENFETTEAIYVKAPPKQTLTTDDEMGLFSKLTNRIIDNVVDKTLAKTSLSQAEKDAAIAQLDDAREASGVNKKIDTFDKVVSTVGTAGVAVGTALLPGVGSLLGGGTTGLTKTGGALAAETSTRAKNYAQNDAVPAWVWLALIPVGLLLMGKRKIFR
jgi:hypothetical protein